MTDCCTWSFGSHLSRIFLATEENIDLSTVNRAACGQVKMQEKCERFNIFSPLAGGCSVGLHAFIFLCNVKCLCTGSVGGQGTTTVFVKYGIGFIGLAINTNAETKKTTRSSNSRQSLCWVQPSEISRNFFQLLFGANGLGNVPLGVL